MEALPSSASYPERAGRQKYVLQFWLPVLCSWEDASHNLLEENKLFSQAFVPRSWWQVGMPLGWWVCQPGKGGFFALSAEISGLSVAGNDILYEHTLG